MNESWVQKIYTRRGICQEPIFGKLKVLHLGCGASKLKGTIGVDLLKLPGVDVVHNLDDYPWPFADNSTDIFFVHSALEHFDNLVKFFDEVWRIGKNGGKIIITVPYFRNIDSFTDPTHKHFFTAFSLDYFLDQAGTLADYRYSSSRFKKLGFWYGWSGRSNNLLVRLFKRFIYRHQKFYDQYLSIVAPVKILIWELEIVK